METPRLILRRLESTDLLDFYEYCKVEGVGEQAGWPHHQNIEESKRILEILKENNTFGIVLKENKKLIGTIGIHNMDGKGVLENSLGYVLSKKYWGQGIMVEACKEIIQYCFETLKLEILWCEHFVDNLQSKRVIEKCGFKFLLSNKYYAKALQKEFDCHRYIISREMYFSGKQ